MGAKRAGAGGADPFRPTLMAALLFGQPLAQGRHQRLKAAKGLDGGAFFGRQVLFGQLFQPVARQIERVQHGLDRDGFKPLKCFGEGAVKAVEIAFILDHRRAGQVVESRHVIGGYSGRHRLQKAKEFA